ncbi:MAG: hypothetical protein NXY59_04645 [Aigarchaeota archaeon]|nr:hypothetical protein [Candidatus Pelearchaeum maunauluense]
MKVVSLDFGGTLAYEPREEYLTYHQLLASMGYRLKQEDVRKAYEKTIAYFKEGGIFGKRVWDGSLHLEFITLLCRDLMIDNAEVAARRLHELFHTSLT